MSGDRLRRAGPWVVLLVVLVAALGYAATTGSGAPSDQDRADRLAREIRCPTCESQSVAESNSEAAETIRADIADRVEAGESDEAIKAAYVERYSEWVLLEPERTGIALVVWLLPLLVVVTAAVALVAYLASRRVRTGVVDSDDEAVVRRARSGDRRP